MALGTQGWAVAGGVMLVACYVLDNCDGEIAVLKDRCTAFGERFDTFVDWLVHVAFFAALGIGTGRLAGEAVWMWLGWAAAAGGTVNHVLGLVLDARDGATPEADAGHGGSRGWRNRLVFVFRELFRADFCFIVLVLAVFDAVWLLLPLGAVGAQVYWVARLADGAGDYHV